MFRMKILPVLLLILVLVLAACGDSTATTAPAAAPTVPVATPTVKATNTPVTTMADMAMNSPMAAMTTVPPSTMAARTTPAAPTTTMAAMSGGAEKTVEITIQDFAFSPASLTVPVGTKVVWTNKDGSGHTVTSNDGTLKSKLLGQGEKFEFVFSKAGTYDYFCTPHPFMQAKIIVS